MCGVGADDIGMLGFPRPQMLGFLVAILPVHVASRASGLTVRYFAYGSNLCRTVRKKKKTTELRAVHIPCLAARVPCR